MDSPEEDEAEFDFYLPGFQLLRLLGKGGMGEVYEAFDKRARRKVALKVLRRDKSDSRTLARFQREAEVMAKLRHPNLIRLYQRGEHQGRSWISMELVQGASLDQILHRSGPLTPEASRELIRVVTEALGVMHQAGVLHRDLKPGNLMLEPKGRPVLMDFGLVKDESREKLTQTGTVLGTPVYLAPEILLGQPFVANVDFYALGITWWECLTGDRPFTFEEIFAAVSKGKALLPPPPRNPHGEVPAKDLALIRRLTGPRDERPQTAEELLSVLAGKPGARLETRTEVLPASEAIQAILEAEKEPSGTASEPESSAGPVLAEAPVGPAPLPGASAPSSSGADRQVPLVFWAGLGFGVLGCLLFLALRGGSSAPGRAGPETPPFQAEVRLFRDAHFRVLEVRGSGLEGLRAERERGLGWVPLPVYAIQDDEAYVGLFGLSETQEPRVRLFPKGQAEAAPVRLRVTQGRGGGKELPAIFRKFGSHRLSEEDRARLEELYLLLSTSRVMSSELDVFEDLPKFQNFPWPFWPVFLRWIEEGGKVRANLMRVLDFGGETLPPKIAWAVFHAYGDPASVWNRTLAVQIRFELFEPFAPPPQALQRLAEWVPQRRKQGNLARLAVDCLRPLLRGESRPPFPHRIPGWSFGIPEGGKTTLKDLVAAAQLPAASVLGEAYERRIRPGGEVAAEYRRSIRERSRGPGVSPFFARVSRSAWEEESNYQALLDDFAGSTGEEHAEIEAVLRSLREIGGGMSHVGEKVLVRSIFHDFDVVRAEASEGTRVEWSSQLELFYALFPAEGAEVTLFGAKGESETFVLKAKAQPKRKSEG